jgi:hypothetical protein
VPALVVVVVVGLVWQALISEAASGCVLVGYEQWRRIRFIGHGCWPQCDNRTNDTRFSMAPVGQRDLMWLALRFGLQEGTTALLAVRMIDVLMQLLV